MNTFVFQPGLTWRKAGFAFFGNSLGYREVLNANAVWDISKHPAPGSVLYKPDNAISSSTSSPRSTTPNGGSSVPSELYFPFESYESYSDALSKYRLKNLNNPDLYNGWSLTSSEVLYGQR